MLSRFLKLCARALAAPVSVCIQVVDCSFPVHEAVRSGNAAEVSRLVSGGASLRKTERGRTALLEALRRNETDSALILIQSGSAVDFQEMLSGARFARPLFYAVSHGNRTLVDELLRAGAGLEDAGYNGMTPLMEAARTDQEELLRLLISRGANIEAGDDSGRTALIWGTIAGHESSVRTLLDSGADAQAKDDSGRGARAYALIFNRTGILALLHKQTKQEIKK